MDSPRRQNLRDQFTKRGSHLFNPIIFCGNLLRVKHSYGETFLLWISYAHLIYMETLHSLHTLRKWKARELYWICHFQHGRVHVCVCKCLCRRSSRFNSIQYSPRVVKIQLTLLNCILFATSCVCSSLPATVWELEFHVYFFAPGFFVRFLTGWFLLALNFTLYFRYVLHELVRYFIASS